MARPGRRAEPALVGAEVWLVVVRLPVAPVPAGVVVVTMPVPAGVVWAGAELTGAELTTELTELATELATEEVSAAEVWAAEV